MTLFDVSIFLVLFFGLILGFIAGMDYQRYKTFDEKKDDDQGTEAGKPK